MTNERFTRKNSWGEYVANCGNCPLKECDVSICRNHVLKLLGELEQMLEDGELVSKDWHDEQVMIYEDVKQKIEQGRLIELPVQVGDTVYTIESDVIHDWGKDRHCCTIKYYPRACKIKNNADLFYFMYMREIDEMFETEEQAFEKLKREKTELEERYADNDFIDEVFVELRGEK